MKNSYPILLCTLICFCLQNAQAQVNYVRSWTATAPEQSYNNLITRSLNDVKQVTQYIDGLGRPMQTVAKQGSFDSYSNPTTPVPGDLISITGYDNLGRQNISYLPYVSTTSTDGTYKSTAATDQPTFYQNTYILTGQGETGTNAHTQINFEASPLNRPSLSMAPGNNWVGASKGIASSYYTNTATDNVKIWSVTNNPIGTFGTYALSTYNSGVYPAGTLFKTSSTDEAGHQILEFKDLDGRVILKKVQLTGASDTGPGNGDYTGWLCTYYIYDLMSNLRCVIQPAGVAALSANGWILTATILNEQCFRYEYDQRRRMNMKQVPGAQAVYMVYDIRDRLVMTQDGNMRTNGKWLVTVYDLLNRPVQTGLLNDLNSLATEAANANTSSSYPSTATGFELWTQTHYDDYTGLSGVSASFISTWNSYFSATNNSSFPYPQFPTQNSVATTMGLATWTKVEVLGSNGTQYLFTSNIYDEKGRIIQTQSQNITGGTDVVTTQYSWSGQPLTVVNSQQKAGTNPQTNVAISSFVYDALGRMTATTKTFVGIAGTVTKTIANNVYDQLGPLHSKTLGPTSSPTGGAIDKLTYDYNIRGWLLGINRAYINSGTTIGATNSVPAPGNYFGEELAYDKLTSYSPMTYAAAQFNGNIAGTVWKSTGDAVPRKYDFIYDAANRLTAANFAQVTPTNAQTVDYSVGGSQTGNIGYDANGNILSMNQKGYRLGNPTGLIDQLTYTYFSGTNKLQNVVDAVNNVTTISGDFRSSQAYMTAIGNPSVKSAAAYDYIYDNNGNLTVDQNKDIGTLNNSTGALVTQGIVYNYLNLPQTVSFNNSKGTITYTYDASGNKLKKLTVESAGSVSYLGTAYTTSITTTTTYLNGMVYQSLAYGNTSLPAGLLQQQYTDKLQFAAHEEGRIRALYTNLTNPTTVTGYAFDYFIKDHLGNTRLVLTDEQSTDPTYAATMETANATAEQQVFANISQTRVAKPGAFDSNAGNASVALTNFSGNKIGPSLLLKVMAGDNLSISVSAYYNATSGTNYNVASLAATDLLTNLLSTSTGIPVTGSTHATLTDLQNNSGVINTSTQNFLSNRTAPNANVPKAYLNYIFLDDQFMYAGGYAAPVTSASSTSAQTLRPNYASVLAPKNGYVYVYVSNESNYNVYFDNLQVIYQHGPIVEDNAYYPFGLTMSGISDQALKSHYAENKYRYNKGSELQNKEFADGSGLEMYTTNLRDLDPQLGRWWQVDSKPDYAQSLYSSMGNNPILKSDPLGDTVKPGGNFYAQIAITMVLSGMAKKSQTAKKSLNKLATSKNVFTINLTSGDSKFTETNVDKAYKNQLVAKNLKQADDPSIQGGSGGEILWNPSQAVLQKGSDEPVVGGAINLAHELFGHALDADQGLMNDEKRDGLANDEIQASHMENKIRSELKIPLRTSYGTNVEIDPDGVRTYSIRHRLLKGTTSVYYPGYDYKKENPPSNENE